MNKIFFIVFALLFCNPADIKSQVDVRASMGINYVTIPSLRDYINDNYAFGSDRLESFNAEVQFSGEASFSINRNYQLGIEYAYSINSYTLTHAIGQYEFFYNGHSPTVIGYYVLPGEGYKFKFGLGAGYRSFQISEKVPPTTFENKYTSTGIGFLIRGEGSTALGGNIYANIGVDLRYDMAGEPENNNNQKIFNPVTNETLKMNAFSVGVRLGASYFF